MKVEIQSSDRIGISQEILSVFADNLWNLKAIEVETCVTYVNIENEDVSLNDIQQALTRISGIFSCAEISLMPAEKRENHLQALLSRIPDPIIDVDEHGKILAGNRAALALLPESGESVVGKNIERFINVRHDELLIAAEQSISVTFAEQPYIADINPVVSNGKVTGAVISLKSIQKLGRQISVMQSSSDDSMARILGESEKISLVKSQTKRFAELELPVLITGDTGTGKELVARALHQESRRKQAPFLTINCAALPEQLLESELFGYAPGAFSGASKAGKPGLFEMAEGGTIFLDEIAEMSVYLQAKLLRFLQDYSYRRVGGTKERNANVRVISASHQDFEQLIVKGAFREDLYYRLNVLKLSLPALTERISDIPILVEHFTTIAAKQVNISTPCFDEDAMNTLLSYTWPGNIRQLENFIFRIVALSDVQVLDKNMVNSLLFDSDNKAKVEPSTTEEVTSWADAQAHFEKQLLQQLLPYYPTTRKLAKRLQVSHNKVAMKLREYNLSR
ncbi:sigma 54-interacting transcriptional regulator [Thalassotalea fusca]